MISIGENPVAARLVPSEPLPRYAFIPGRTPHPVSDPAGHSFGCLPEKPDAIHPQNWQISKPYLFGFDLFNAGFFWESHEQWESLWHACGRSGAVADFLKGLIKLAAAGVKHLEGNAMGVQSHACRAVELWRAVDQVQNAVSEWYLGFRIGTLIELAEDICQQGWPAARVTICPTLLPT